MIIDQGELLQGTTMVFMKEFMELTVRESHNAGDFIFHEGDQATQFYTLIKGNVKLNVGETGQKVYIVSRSGEAFGWSSVVGRDVYSAAAECMEPTSLLRIDRGDLQHLLEKYPDCGLVFYKSLSEVLGKRLLQCYEIISTFS
ncbi:Crp/Fnr family transcriptional regulator [Desulfonema magnum]|uniref:Cyclic nucleotide-binding domain-containing protein n=1 Tax=Desulfonema magnum TaxID=45655 RepID=A0A975GSX6_9BACT|nr:cyclic nucleotide-binding domain-containing protein [Desulfonema magnum]QTA92501.1 Cyclic nucleotide-binding domain-containing protein [Desulfonema magnum]